MSKLVVINLGLGDLQGGCPHVTAQIPHGGDNLYPIKCLGSLPAAPEIEQLYKQWQLLYREFYREHSLATRMLAIEPGGVTHFSEVEFSELSHQLKARLNSWLTSDSFLPIDRKLSRVLDPAEEIRVIIETNDAILRRLPWHLWNFFEDFPRAEVALSVQEYGQAKPQSQTSVGVVRILAVLGSSDQINLQADRQVLKELPGAAPLFLEEPTYQELHEQLWARQGWDILFFAGHSKTEADTGRIYINQQDSLTPDQLRNALKQAINQGLKLAIFNSCDGLGLAQALADLHIPQVIVMRELVPDEVAQVFFRHFITRFSAGQSLYAAVREAREKLEKLEGDYPYGTWLPVICQNPTERLITWEALQGSRKAYNSSPSRQMALQTLLLVSVVLAALVMGIRQLGVIQNWELQAFDALVKLRPVEPPDPRLLLVTVTEKDVQSQNPQERRGSSLSDRTLAQLLTKIQTYQPRVIGLDLYRDFPVDSDQSDLAAHFQQNSRFIAVCEVGENSEHPGTRSLPGVPDERLSFSDLPVDPDGVIRRQLLGMAPSPESFCVTDTSFSLRVAQVYLAQQGIQIQRQSEGTLQIGNTLFKQIESETGGYHQLDALGYQVLLNYRSSDLVAEQVTLTQLLSDSVRNQLPSLIKDRIVLIGTTAESFNDYSPTPYSKGRETWEMPGVMIQAHMVSQILSAVLDQRTLIWWLPTWGETLWVWVWGLGGGAVILCLRSPLHRGLAIVATLGILVGVCFILLLEGGWMPLVPSALALVATEITLTIYLARWNEQSKSTSRLQSVS